MLMEVASIRWSNMAPVDDVESAEQSIIQYLERLHGHLFTDVRLAPRAKGWSCVLAEPLHFAGDLTDRIEVVSALTNALNVHMADEPFMVWWGYTQDLIDWREQAGAIT